MVFDFDETDATDRIDAGRLETCAERLKGGIAVCRRISEGPAGFGDPARSTDVKIEVAEPMGAETYLYLDTGTTSFVARVRPTDRFEINRRIKVTFDVDKAHLFDATTEQVLK